MDIRAERPASPEPDVARGGGGNDSQQARFKARWLAESNPAARLAMIEQEFCPPEPQLLDTSVLQNLDWVDRQIEPTGSVTWDDAATSALTKKYGRDLADDLLDLGTLYKRFESDGGYPWTVCSVALAEAGLFKGPNGVRLRQLIGFLADHQGDWSGEAYPGIALGQLRAPGRPSPLILRALGVAAFDQVHAADGPLAFLPDAGDRLTTAHALLANIPVVLTTDRKTFWAHREKLAELGLKIMRPVELLALYELYWAALDAEFARRRKSS